MIGYLQGTVLWRGEEELLLNVHGVGYEVHCSLATLQWADEGSAMGLWIYTHVREDLIHLFGFSDMAEKRLFLSLISVSGIGPKMALKMLSAVPADEIVRLIDGGDVKGLMRLPKVGKKLAEQMVLTLKGQLVLAEGQNIRRTDPTRSQIFSALVNLGFKESEVDLVVREMPGEMSVEEGVRAGLQRLTVSG